MARTSYKLHNPLITGANNPAYQISKNAYDADHNEAGMVGFVPSNKTLATNLIVVTDTVTTVDPQSGATDHLDFIDYSNTNDKDVVFLFNHNGANTITAKHNVASPPAGSLSLFLLGGANQVLSTTVPLVIQRIGTTGWYQIIPFNSPILNAANTWTANNTFTDSMFFIANAADATKLVKFDVSSIASGTTRTITIQNVNDTMAVLGTAQTWTAAQTHNSNIIMNSADISIAGNNIKTTNYNYVDVNTTDFGNVVIFQNSGTNNPTRQALVPNGTGKASWYVVYRTSDYTTNREMFLWGSDRNATGEFFTSIEKQGTGVARPWNVYMLSTKVFSFDIANTLTSYVDHNFQGKILSTAVEGGAIGQQPIQLSASSNELGIAISNTQTGGKNWLLGSIGNSSGLTGGTLSIYDITDSVEIMNFSSSLITFKKPLLPALSNGTNVFGTDIAGQGSFNVTSGSTSTIFGGGNNFQGLFVVCDVTNNTFALVGSANGGLSIIYQGSTDFVTNSSPTASQSGIYVSANVVTLKNGWAVTHTYRVLCLVRTETGS